MSDGTERHRQDTVDGIENSIYIWDEKCRVCKQYIKWHCLKWLVLHVLHKNGNDAVGGIEFSINIWDE